ncbi:MAG: class I SAM-dependent methyltransferase [Halobacteriota archaeon]
MADRRSGRGVQIELTDFRVSAAQYADGTYLEKVQDCHVGDSPWKASKVLQMMEKNHLTCESIYDIGCGAGQILVELQKEINRDVALAGFDISPQAIEIARSKEDANLKFYNDDFLKAKVASADLVLLLDVFEHVPDYLGFLDALRKKTKWVIFHIPLDMCARTILSKSNYMLYMRKRYGHLHYFSKETALATLANLGYEVVDYFYTFDDEIRQNTLRGFEARMIFQIRKNMFRFDPGLAAAIFPHFNLLVLARGDQD